MHNNQKDIYIELLENQVHDLEQKVEEMNAELLELAHQLANQRIPTLTTDSCCGGGCCNSFTSSPDIIIIP